MGSFNKRYVVRAAEDILEECNKNLNQKDEKRKLIDLKNKYKKLKNRNIFWKICTAVMSILFLMAII